METPLINLSLFLPIIEKGEPIITANSRLSAKIIQAYGWYLSKSKGIHVTEKPAVYSLGEWLEAEWQSAQAQGDQRTVLMRLNASQRLSIWESIIAERLDALPMARADHLSHTADKALRSLLLWQLTLEDVHRYISPFQDAQTHRETQDNSPFLQWAKAFLAYIDQKQWITAEQQQARLLAIANERSEPIFNQLYLYGFDDIPPLTQALLEASSQQLTRLKSPPQAPETHSVQRIECQQLDDEIAQAARWSWQQLQHNPDQRIGIIVPQLGQIRDRVERQFIATFEAHALLPEQARYTLPFNFSAGIPLGQCPLIAQALCLLRWVNGQSLPWHQVKTLLLSPFWQLGHDESLALFWLQTLQDKEQTEWQWQEAVDCLHHQITKKDFPEYLSKPDIVEWLAQLSKRLAPFNIQKITHDQAMASSHTSPLSHSSPYLPMPKTPKTWVEQFAQQLNILGWPGARRLDSQEYQQMTEWQQGLGQIPSMALVTPSWSPQEALSRVSQRMNTTPFQALTPDSPIQILGALEGAGLTFDACWIMGLDNQQWPAAANPNPLLPVALQRDHKMPNATPERELEFAESLTQSYLQSAPNVIVSSAQFDGEKELHPSPLIDSIALTPLHHVVSSTECACHLHHHHQTQWQARQWEWVPTHFSAPFPQQVQEQPGGASLLQWQSSNPMDAFARFRLGLFSLPDVSDHLASYVKGNVTHKVLEVLWKSLKTQEQLLALSDEQRKAMVDDAVSQALGNEPILTHQYGQHFRALEHQRQGELIEHWLQVEMHRPPFRIASIETQQRMTLANLSLNIRLDRVDVLLDEQHQACGSVLIDYKTGSCNRSDWLFERIKSPQLPLYAVGYPTELAEESVSAIAFGQLKAGSIQLTGMSNEYVENSIDANWDKKEDWYHRIYEWQQQLTQLAIEWLNGDCHNHYYHADAAKYQQEYFAFNRWPEKQALYHYWQQEQTSH